MASVSPPMLRIETTTRGGGVVMTVHGRHGSLSVAHGETRQVTRFELTPPQAAHLQTLRHRLDDASGATASPSTDTVRVQNWGDPAVDITIAPGAAMPTAITDLRAFIRERAETALEDIRQTLS